MNSRDFVQLAVLGVALEACLLGLRWLAPLDQHVPELVGLALAAGLLYLFAAYRILHTPRQSSLAGTPRPGRSTLLLILVAAVAFRLTLVGVEPTLSDDLYRHQWEGRIQVAGWNPYLVAPDDPRLAPLRDENFSRIPGPHVPSAYPPLAELYFYGLARVDGLPTFKWAALGLDLAVIGLLLLLLRARGEPLVRVLVYAWCPLVVVEFAGNGHYDALVLAALLVANLLIIGKRGLASMAALAAAALTKWFAALLLPVFLTRMQPSTGETPFDRAQGRPVPPARHKALPYPGLLGLGAFLAACALITWPYAGAGRKLIAGLVAYGEQWRNNESLFRLLSWAAQRDDVAAGLALGMVVGVMVFAAQQRTEPLRASYWLVGAILLLSPSVFPWYVTWLVPFLCFYPRAAGLLFSVTVLLAYHVVIGYRATGTWQYDPWLVALEYAPVYALLVWQAFQKTQQK